MTKQYDFPRLGVSVTLDFDVVSEIKKVMETSVHVNLSEIINGILKRYFKLK